jgi:hypothetical protein
MGDTRNAYKIFVKKSEWKNRLGRLGLDGKIILKWILHKSIRKIWIGYVWLRKGTMVMNLQVQ